MMIRMNLVIVIMIVGPLCVLCHLDESQVEYPDVFFVESPTERGIDRPGLDIWERVIPAFDLMKSRSEQALNSFRLDASPDIYFEEARINRKSVTEALEKKGINVKNLIKKYGSDALDWIVDNGPEAVEWVRGNGPDAYEWITNHGKEGAKYFVKNAKEVPKFIKKYGPNVYKLVNKKMG